MKLKKRKIKNLSSKNRDIQVQTDKVAGGVAMISGHACNFPVSFDCHSQACAPETVFKVCLPSVLCIQ